MRFHLKSFLLTAALYLPAASPTLAQTTEAPERTSRWLALLLTWSPLLIFFGFFWFFVRKVSVRASRIHAHMDRVEQLLERLVESAEKSDRRQ